MVRLADPRPLFFRKTVDVDRRVLTGRHLGLLMRAKLERVLYQWVEVVVVPSTIPIHGYFILSPVSLAS